MDYKFLNKINSPHDIKKLTIEQLDMLCSEIREFLVDNVSKTGGHLASNLGTVELTVAIHKVFNSPVDSILWDVGHQAYTHKIITGRRECFNTLRCTGGISGFTRPSEHPCDAFIAGHAGNSLSAAYGIAVANRLSGKKSNTISVTGDGALGNGMLFEAMNNAGRSTEKLIFIINDNEMSISSNVGAVAKYLAEIRSTNKYFQTKDIIEKSVSNIPLVGNTAKSVISISKSALKNYLYQCNFFESFGFTYLGPVNGHDLASLTQVLARAKNLNKPVVVHVNTKKGKGYTPAQKNPEHYHGVSSFDKSIGINLKNESFSHTFGKTLNELAKTDKKIVAITSAMTDGTGLKEFAENYSNQSRFFDTGIAEEHAVTFAAGLASKGLKPVVALYSTFIQRCYDQIVHDASIESQHIVFAVDRAGIVGEDGETHQGILDVAMLRSIPDITIYSPASYKKLNKALKCCLNVHRTPVVLRYPRGSEPELLKEYNDENIDFNHYDANSDKIIVTYGRIWSEVCGCREMLKMNLHDISLMNITKIHPINPEIISILCKYDNIFFYEEGIRTGGVGEGIALKLLQSGYKGNFDLTAIDGFIEQSDIKTAHSTLLMDRISMYNKVKKFYET